MPMTPLERKAAFKYEATLREKTLDGAAKEFCGVTWFHLSQGLAEERDLSADLRQKFAAFIGRSVEDVFGGQPLAAAQ